MIPYGGRAFWTALVQMHQAITWTNADLLSIRPLATNVSEIWTRNKIVFIPENAFGDVTCNMETICWDLKMWAGHLEIDLPDQ